MGVILRGAQIVDGYEDSDGNRIIGSPHVASHAIVEFKSKGCAAIFADGAKLHGAIFFQRENSNVSVGSNTLLRGRTSLGANCDIFIGCDVYSGMNLQLTTAEGCSITIGDDVLIANDCRIRADDSHPIYDGHSGERINPSESIHVGDHVWIGQEVFLLPGSQVGKGSVIGARSVVTKSRPVPNNCLAIGSPAKIHRRGIHWVRKHLQAHEIPESIDPPLDAEPEYMTAEPEVILVTPRRRWLDVLRRTRRATATRSAT